MDTQKKPQRFPLLGVVTLFSFLLPGWLALPASQAQVVESNDDSAEVKPTPTPGSLRGRVLYADTGRPVRHAGIYLEKLSEPTDEEEERGRDAPHTVADINGEFWFPKITPGRYIVYANDGGLAQLHNYPHTHLSLAERIRTGKLTEGFAEITVTSGKEVSVEITGRRSGAITGRVYYADSAPVAQARVLVFRRDAAHSITPVASGIADSRGVYRVAQLPGGEYIVAARDRDVDTRGANDEKQAYSSGLMVAAYYPAARTSRKAAPVTVPDGQDAVGIDITLPDSRMRAVSGTVTLKTAGQPPVGQARVSLVRLEKEPGQPAQPAPLQLFAGNQEKYSTASNASGEWSISGVPDGLYQLKVQTDSAVLPPPADAPAERRPIEAGALSLTQEFTVKGEDITGWRIELLKGGRLETVVSTPKGVTMPEYLILRAVLVNNDNPEITREGHCLASADEPGCLIDGLLPGSYLLRVEPDEEEKSFYIKSIMRQGQDVTRVPFKISAGQTIKGVSVLVSDKTASVSGKVLLDRTGKKPAANKLLALMPADALTRRLWGEPQTMKTESDGSFSFGNVEPGSYFLFVPDPKAKLDDEFWRAHAATLPRLTLKPGAQIKDYEVFTQ